MHLSHLSTLFFSFDTPLFQRLFKTYINDSIFWKPFSDLTPGTANLRITCSIFRRQLKHFSSNSDATQQPRDHVITGLCRNRQSSERNCGLYHVCTMNIHQRLISCVTLSQFSARGFLGHPLLVRQGFKVSHAGASGLNKLCFPRQIASHSLQSFSTGDCCPNIPIPSNMCFSFVP